MDFSKIFSLGFYFSHTNLGQFDSWWLVLSWGLGLILTGIGWGIYRRFKLQNNSVKKLSKAYASRLVWFGVAALGLLWFRVEAMPYLSLRFWWVIYFIILGVTLYFTIRNFKRKYHVKIKSEHINDEEYKKYIPKPKKKKRK
jgi:amino acid transporter